MIEVYGISKPKNGRDHIVNPLRDLRICEAEVGFAETIAKLMAQKFTGELYYVWDPISTKILFSFCVWEEENGVVNYDEINKHDKMFHLREEAMKVCNFRNHNMENWIGGDNNSHSVCLACGETVHVTTSPQPNSINISGTAIDLYCERKN